MPSKQLSPSLQENEVPSFKQLWVKVCLATVWVLQTRFKIKTVV